MHFFNSTEFYVIIFVAAAAIVALLLRPSGRGAARELLLGSRLSCVGSNEEPEIAINVLPNYSLEIIRSGIEGVRSDGAVSAKAEIRGYEIYISEHLVSGRGDDAADTATFVIEGLAPDERYFLRYEAESISAQAQINFRLTPGLSSSRPLKK